MNNRGQKATLGFAFLLVAFILIITAFATIEPMKEFLDTARGSKDLNCKGTVDFNQTAYDEDDDNSIARLTRRPTCFITGITMIYFIGSFLIAVAVWTIAKWRKIK